MYLSFFNGISFFFKLYLFFHSLGGGPGLGGGLGLGKAQPEVDHFALKGKNCFDENIIQYPTKTLSIQCKI
jgi:hypothetical protein